MSRVLFDKVKGLIYSINSQPLMECGDSLACSYHFVSFLTQMNQLHALPFYRLMIQFNTSFHLHLRLSGSLFLSVFPTKTLYTFLFSPMHTTCPTLLTFL